MKEKMDLKIVGEGATTTVYKDGDKAIKLYPKKASMEHIKAEVMRQKLAHELGLPVPEVYEIKEFDNGSTGIIMQCVEGVPIMHPNMAEEEFPQALATLVELQCHIHSQDGTGFPIQAEQIKIKIDRNRFVKKKVKKQLQQLLEELTGDATSLCHGDFHPLNILNDGNKYWIIDWVDATVGNPLADVCRSYLILMQFAPELTEAYLKIFCMKSGFVQEDILAWLPIIAAGRLTEGVDKKAKEMLMDIINNWSN